MRPSLPCHPLAAVLGLAVALGTSAGTTIPPWPAELLEATPFRLAEPVPLPSGASASSGLIVVIRAGAGLLAPRQGPMPVPQMGASIILPASRGGDGMLVGIVLGDVDPGAAVLFLSPPAGPEPGDVADAARTRLDAAVRAGLQPIGAEAAARALAAGTKPLQVARFEDLAPALLALRCRIEPEALARAGTPCPEAP